MSPIESKSIEVVQDDKIDPTDLAIASTIGAILHNTYHGYHWLGWSNHLGGLAGFNCLEINMVVRANMPPGMSFHLHKLSNHKALCKIVIRMGGELLERANLPRTRWNGDYPVKVDGLADRHQPLDFILKQINIKGLFT